MQRPMRFSLTQTIQTAKQPFMPRFRCDIARKLGFPLFETEDGGSLRILYES